MRPVTMAMTITHDLSTTRSFSDAPTRRKADAARILYVGRLGNSAGGRFIARYLPVEFRRPLGSNGERRYHAVRQCVSARSGNFLTRLSAHATRFRTGAAVGFSGRLQHDLYAALVRSDWL